MTDLKWLMRIWPHAKPDGWVLLFALMATPLMAVCSLVQPWLIKQVIDDHIVPGELTGMSQLVLCYLGAVVLA